MIIQRKTFHKQRITKFTLTKNDTVDINMLAASADGDKIFA